MKYTHILRRFMMTPWAIDEGKLFQMRDFLTFAATGGILSAEEVQARITPARERKTAEATGAIAVIPVVGIISQRGGNMDDISGPMGVSTERVSGQLRAALSSPDIKAVILDIDSPGGTVEGVDELSTEIFNARSAFAATADGGKPIIAVANAWAASAAYWIASAADELVVTPSGEVGSVGVYAAHVDETKFLEMEGLKTTLITAGKFKAESHPWQPLTEDAKAAIQADVDHFYGLFVDAVARNRGVSGETVLEKFGQGRMVTAEKAVRLGMADRVATLRETIERFGAVSASGKGKRQAEQRARSLDLLEIA